MEKSLVYKHPIIQPSQVVYTIKLISNAIPIKQNELLACNYNMGFRTKVGA